MKQNLGKLLKKMKSVLAEFYILHWTAIDSCANLLYPFMPSTSEIVRSAIPKETENKWGVK